MIFRRPSNDLPLDKQTTVKQTTGKRTMSNTRLAQVHAGSGIDTAPLSETGHQINSPSTLSSSGSSMSQNNTNNNVGSNQPLSPLAMAQSRRNTNTSPAASFRQDQLRKLTVGRDISLNGEITTCDHLIVEGNVTATIKGGQILEIADCGSFNGVVDIEQADIAGAFEGDLTVRGKLILRSTAIVAGTLLYGTLQVEAGATLNGQIGVLPPEAALAPVEMPRATAKTETKTETAETKTAKTDGKTEGKTDANLYNLGSINDQPGFLKASA